MLKLPKGLKKKKKGKKSKKDQELFTEEELKQYKQQLKQKELEQEQQLDGDHPGKTSASDTEGAKGASSKDPNKSEQDEEWLKFKALTAGVDSIVHKTQEDLDRIKSQSFFQRVPPPSEQKKKKEQEAARREAERLEEERRKKEEEEANRDVLAEAVVELSESEEESEEADDIFNTEYIEAITSGEVQLAVVPDSPDFPIDEGPDPFDTSYADKLIKGPEVSKRGKKLVNIGAAVEVLTGRVESYQPAGAIRRKPRKGVQDLLLDAANDEVTVSATPEPENSLTPEPPRTLLDVLEDDAPIELPPIDLSVSLHLTLQKQAEESKVSDHGEKSDVISEFDILKDEENDEFAELAIKSLTKKEEVNFITQVPPLEYTGIVSSDWAEFENQKEELAEEASAKAKPSQPPPVASNSVPAPLEIEDGFDLVEDDPFDTTFVEKVIPVQTKEEDDFDFDPRADESLHLSELKGEKDLLGSNTNLTVITSIEVGLTVSHKDLLGGSVTDLSAVGPAPINPQTDKVQNEESDDFDPFDTSAVISIVQPKETELKFLEKELLEESKLKHSVSDPDFDPRAGEDETQQSIVSQKVDKSEQARRKSSLHLNIHQKAVGFLVPDPDLLGTDHASSKIHKPLTPYYTNEQALIETEVKEAEDPFDTSFVPDSKPTQVELNLLEKDLLSNTSLKHSVSDPDFDPRAENFPEVPVVEEIKSDLLAVENQINIKVLTPSAEISNHEIASQQARIDIIDPFDTSSVELNILPGKTELKLIENELLTSRSPETITGVLDTLTDAQELGLGDKVLTPQATPAVASISPEEVDPFDTSFAENLGPGKAEIKVLESELI